MRHWLLILLLILLAVSAFGQAPARSGGQPYAEATACAKNGVILCEDFNYQDIYYSCIGGVGIWTNPGLVDNTPEGSTGQPNTCTGMTFPAISGFPAQPAGSPAGGNLKYVDTASGPGYHTGCLWSDCMRTTLDDPVGKTYANGLPISNDLYVRFQVLFSSSPAYKWPSFDNKILIMSSDKYVDKPSANIDAVMFMDNFWCPSIMGGTAFQDAITFRVGDNSCSFKSYPGDNTSPTCHPPHNEYCTGDGMPTGRPDTSPAMECTSKHPLTNICSSPVVDDTPYPGRGFRFSRGEWYTVEFRYKLNSPGIKNGIIETWVNGTKVYSDNDMETCATLTGGGGCAAIAEFTQFFWYNPFQELNTEPKTPVQGYALLDNLIMSTQPIGVPGTTTRYIDSGATGCTNGSITYNPQTRTCGGATPGTDRMYTSLQNALAAGTTIAGDTLDIRAGTYNESLDTNTQTLPSGTDFAGGAVTIRAHAGETVIFRSSAPAVFNIVSGNHHIIFDRLIVDGALQSTDPLIGGGTISIGSGGPHHIRIQDCEVRNAANVNIIINRGSGVGHEILRNKLYGAGRDGNGYGIYAESDGITFSDNEVYNNTGYGIHFYSAHTSGDQTSDNHIISGNNIHNNLTSSTPPYVGTGGCAVIDGSNNLYFNNICNTNGGSVGIDANYSSGSGNQIYNNTIIQQGTGIRIESQFSNTIVKNNIVRTHNNLTGAITNNGTATSFAKNLGCLPTPNCYSSANPDFVSFATNLRTQPGSSARGQGEDLTALGLFTVDIEGTPRTGAWDIGAYESSPLVTNITLSSPDGGNSWAVGSSQSITYAYSNVANVDIELDLGNDGTFEIPVAMGTTANGSYAWTVPNNPTITARIRVKDSASATQDISAANFEIKSTPGGSITVIISDNTSGPKIGTITGTTNTMMTQSAPTTANAGTLGIRANKGTAGQFSYSVIKFPTATIPSTATVTAAELGLYLTSFTTAGAVSIDFRNNKRAFVEGQATYNIYSTGNSWTTPGGLGAADRDSTVLCNMVISAVSPPPSQFYTCSGVNLTAWAQSLVNLSTANNGVHVERNGSGLDGFVRVFGSNTGDASQRPYLSVTYTTTAPTISVVAPTAQDAVFPDHPLGIRWGSQGISGNVTILLSRDGGLNYPELIAAQVLYNSPDYVWPLVTPGRSNNCKIKVISLDNPSVFGESAPFRIRGRRTRLTQ